VLVDANALLLTDIPVGERFTTGIHLRSYTFDAKNSSFDALKNSADQTSFVVSAHYQNPRATLPPAPAAPAPTYPPFTTLPDGRSLFLGYTYNFVKLPDPMVPRRADVRVGHFQSQVWDFSTDAKFTAKTHFVNRWRLEKKDPDAAVSEPKEPIVYWIDRNVPEKYRASVRAGILEWNKAFEKAGLQGRDRRQAAGPGGHGRHVRRPPLDGAVVRCHGWGFCDRTFDRRWAHRRNPQCSGRDSRRLVAVRPHDHLGAGAVRLPGVRRQRVARPRRSLLHVRLGSAG
jgi:hypothetical protein